ncbi:MAG: hypothetical protein ABI234_17920 [Ktedonobacteraceae bacterium]
MVSISITNKISSRTEANMVKRKSLVLLAVIFLLCTCLTLSLTPKSYASTSLLRVNSCTVTQITLHGTAAHTIQSMPCRTPKKTGAGVSPLISTSSGVCPADDLILYYNGPVGAAGPILCVGGFGELDLTFSLGGVFWNDVASAWWTGCQDAFFYVDIQRGGNFAFAQGSDNGASSPSGIFPYQSRIPFNGRGTVGNDQLSSIYLQSGNHQC